MTTLTQRGRNANNAARLPALAAQTQVTDTALRNFLEGVREYLEVRLGSRGDYFERAVTFRDLDPLTAELDRRLDALEAGGADAFDPSDLQRQINQLRADIQYLRSQLLLVDENYKSLTLQLNSQVGDSGEVDPYWQNVVALISFDGVSGDYVFRNHANRGEIQGVDSATGNQGAVLTDSQPGKFSGTVLHVTKRAPRISWLRSHGDYSALAIVPNRVFTAEGWFRVPSGGATNHYICSMWEATPNRYFELRVANNPSAGNLMFRSMNNAEIAVSTGYTVDTWHFFQVISDGSTITVYVDGTSIASDTAPTLGGVSSEHKLCFGSTAQSTLWDLTTDGGLYMQECRFTVGVERSTTVPTVRFPRS